MANPLIKFIESVCVQTAVYWGVPQPDGYGGYTYAIPREVKVRWDGKTQLIRTNEGKEVMADVELLVTEELEVGALMKLATLDELSDSDIGSLNPMEETEVYEVLSKVDTPLFRSTDEFARTVYLGKNK